MTARAEWLKGNRATREQRVFQPWLDRAAEISGQFAKQFEDDPFAYNETASVSLLCSAAVAEGYLALAEFMQEKRASTRGRPYVSGRWDLWLGVDPHQWGMEFKQIKGRFMPDRIAAAMTRAMKCAGAIEKTQTDCRMGVVIASLRSGTLARDRARKNLHAFARGCDHAWLIDLKDGDRETYFFFNYVR